MEKLLGAGLTILSAVAFGAMPIFANIVYRDGVTPTSLLFLRFALAAVVMGIWLAIQKIPVPRGRTLFYLFLLGGVGYAGQSFSYFTALKYAPAGLVAVLLYLYPALVTVVSVFVLKQSITPLKWGALVLSLLGILLVIGVQSGGQLMGIALGILAAFIYTAYILFGAQVIRQADVRASSAMIFASAAMVYGGVVMAQGLSLPVSYSGWGAMLGLAFFSTVIAVWAFFEGVKRIGAVDAAMLSTLEPVVTVALGWSLLGERLTMMNMLGGSLIVIAALLLARSEKLD